MQRLLFFRVVTIPLSVEMIIKITAESAEEREKEKLYNAASLFFIVKSNFLGIIVGIFNC